MLRCSIALLMLVGCASADLQTPDAEPATCAAVVERWKALVDTPAARSCATDADCVFVGGPRTGCDCGPSLAGCGVPSGRSAASSDEARMLETRFDAECSHSGGMCDCGRSEVRCVLGACVAGPRSSCFGPPDAG